MLALKRSRSFTYFELNLFALSLIAYGMYANALISDYWLPFHAYNISLLLFVLGYWHVKKVNRSGYLTTQKKRKVLDWRAPLVLFSLMLVAMITHFSYGGIALLSADIDFERFNTSGSGLFGLPFRLTYWGLPFLCYYLYYTTREVGPNKKLRFLLIVSVLLFLLSRVLMGFKGALIPVLYLLMFISDSPVTNKLTNLKIELKKYFMYLFLGAFVIIAFFAIGNNYSTVTVDTEYLAARLTERSAHPYFYLIENRAYLSDYLGFDSIMNDIKYVMKPFVSALSSEKYLLNTSKYIASDFFGGRDLLGFIAPITLLGFGQFQVFFGLYFGVLACWVLGYLQGVVRSKVSRSSTPMTAAIYGYLGFVLFEFIMKGNFVYLAFNSMTILFILVFVAKISVVRVGRSHSDISVLLGKN